MSCAVSGSGNFCSCRSIQASCNGCLKSRDNKRNAVLVLVNRKGNDRYIALPLRDA